MPFVMDPCLGCKWPPGRLAQPSSQQSALSALDHCLPITAGKSWIHGTMDRVFTGTTESASRSLTGHFRAGMAEFCVAVRYILHVMVSAPFATVNRLQ